MNNLFRKVRETVLGTPSSKPQRQNKDFLFNQLLRFGLDSPVSVCTFDPVQSLLALGTSNGSICLLGKDAVQFLELERPASSSAPPNLTSMPAPVKLLAFKPGDKYLVSVNTLNVVTVWNLQTCQPQFPPVAIPDGVITCINFTARSTWMFLGLATGDVVVMDSLNPVRRGGGVSGAGPSGNGSETVLSPYRIAYQQVDEALANEQEAKGVINQTPEAIPVAAVQLNPVDTNTLLVSYQSGLTVTWDLRQRKVVRRYQLSNTDISNVSATNSMSPSSSPVTLTCAYWRHDGEQFVTSYSNGQLAFWAIAKEGWLSGITSSSSAPKPLLVRTLSSKEKDKKKKSEADSQSQVDVSSQPIQKLYWLPKGSSGATNNTATSVLFAITGGSASGLTMMEFPTAKDYANPRKHLFVPSSPQAILDFAIIPPSGPTQATKPDEEEYFSAFILLANGSGPDCMQAYTLRNEGPQPLTIPRALQLSTTPSISTIHFANGSEYMGLELGTAIPTNPQPSTTELQSTEVLGSTPSTSTPTSNSPSPLNLQGGSLLTKTPTTYQLWDILTTSHPDTNTLLFWSLNLPTPKLLSSLPLSQYISLTA
ncbi:hypothetical protein HK102_003923, partial [Quaeritorhiza haematococci]